MNEPLIKVQSVNTGCFYLGFPLPLATFKLQIFIATNYKVVVFLKEGKDKKQTEEMTLNKEDVHKERLEILMVQTFAEIFLVHIKH